MNDPRWNEPVYHGFSPGHQPGHFAYRVPPGYYGMYATPYYGYAGRAVHGAEAQRKEPQGVLDGQSGRFVLGLLMGAGAIYLLSNEGAQQAAIRTAVKGWHTVRGGFEELKERFRDAEAELAAPPSEP